ARGEEGRPEFMRDIAGYVTEVVAAVRAAPAAVASVAQAVGACPRCAGAVLEKFKFYACDQCDFKLWKRIVGKTVPPALAGVLLRARRTRVLPGFRSAAGKRFSAAIVLDDTGAAKLEFGPPTGRARARRPRTPRAAGKASCATR